LRFPARFLAAVPLCDVLPDFRGNQNGVLQILVNIIAVSVLVSGV
jgi:hypothetical protein